MSTDDEHRGTARAALRVAVGSLLVAMVLGGCVSEPQESPTPVAEDGPSPSDDPTAPSDDPTSPSDDPTSPSEPSPTGGATPDDDPTTPTDPRTGGSSSTDGWRAPADPTAEGPTAAPVLPEVHGALEEDVSLPTGIVVSLVSLTATTIEGKTPGEYSGPAVVVEVHLVNNSEGPQAVDSAVVTLVADDGEIGVPTWSSPYAPFHGEVPAGGSVEGTYVFMLDPARDRAVTVSVNPAAGEPLAVFAGEIS